MKKVTLIENCFGPDILIDDQSVFNFEFDNRNPEDIEKLQNDILLELSNLKSKLGIGHWYQITEIIINLSEDYKFDTNNSKEITSCEQCGNWNHKHVYIKNK